MGLSKPLSEQPLITSAHLTIDLVLLGEAGHSIPLGKAHGVERPALEATLRDQHLGGKGRQQAITDDELPSPHRAPRRILREDEPTLPE